MSRVRCVISCPIDIYAGYGARSRDVVKELIRVRPDWDISILSQRWGDCRFGYLEDHKEFDLMTRLIGGLDFKPDVWIQITVPNEFQRVGTYNIGMTAAMETTLCDVEWIRGCNRMDLVITSSNHGKFSLENSKWIENNTGTEISLKTPVEVLFEGLDTTKYRASKVAHSSYLLEGIKNSWNFLCVGHWMQGDFGEDRKNIGYTIKSFLETFKDREGQVPGLILKVSRATSSILDREEILGRIRAIRRGVSYKKSLPNIYLLNGDLSDQEMNDLYNDPRVKALVSHTKGEGFGRPLLEFAAVGKPVIVSGWSGQLDFLDKAYTAFIGGTIEKVHPSAVQPGMILAEASWFRPNDSEVVGAYNTVFGSYDFWKKKAEQQAKIVNSTWTMEHMGDVLDEVLRIHVPSFPEQVELILPPLE